MRKSLCAGPMGFVMLVFAAGRVAAAVPVNLTWNAPEGCPSSEAVLAQVQGILGASTSGHRIAASAQVTEMGTAHWSVHLATRVDGVQGERTLDADSCASLAAATALILAWTADPSKAAPLAAPEPGGGGAIGATTQAQSRSPRGGSPPLAAFVAASGKLEGGTLPALGEAGEMAVGGLLGPVRVELSGADWILRDASTKIRGTLEGAHVHVLDGALRGCFRGRLGARLEVDPCLGAAVVSATSDGFGGTTFQPQHNAGMWGALRGDALAAWPLFGPVALRASVGVGIPLRRPSFVVNEQNPAGEAVLYTPSAVTVTATLGVEARFP